MKRETIDLTQERHILTSMIMSTEFLRGLVGLVKPQLFKSSYAQQVSAWVLEYFAQYQEAPEKNIQAIYMQKSKQLHDEEDSETIAEFLTRLDEDSEEFKIQNLEYALSEAIKYLKLRSIAELKDNLAYALTEGDPQKAEALVANFNRVEPMTGEGVSIFQDASAVISSFMEENDVLFNFPGALGQVAGQFLRGDLVAWLGFMKRGKTWWLWYTGEIAAFAGLKVLFCTLEMPQRQMLRRAWQGLEGLPRNASDVTLPYFQRETDEGLWHVASRIERREGINPTAIPEKQKKLRMMLRRGDIRVEAFPAYSATVEDIITHLDTLRYFDNFEPDVVIIDYADIIKPSGNNNDYRHQLDAIWKKLRGLAQERNILVVTASQADRSSSTRDADEGNVAEDIRKLAHVSKMLAINRIKEEAKRGVVRISQLAEREGSTSFDQAVVLQCLDIGKPYLDSRLKSEVFLEF